MFVYGCDNAALIVSAFIDSRAMHSYISKSLVTKLNLPLVFGKKLAITLTDGF